MPTKMRYLGEDLSELILLGDEEFRNNDRIVAAYWKLMDPDKVFQHKGPQCTRLGPSPNYCMKCKKDVDARSNCPHPDPLTGPLEVIAIAMRDRCVERQLSTEWRCYLTNRRYSDHRMALCFASAKEIIVAAVASVRHLVEKE